MTQLIESRAVEIMAQLDKAFERLEGGYDSVNRI
jgi:hypothetical protein